MFRLTGMFKDQTDSVAFPLVLEVDAVRARDWTAAAAQLGSRSVTRWLAALARRRVRKLRRELPPADASAFYSFPLLPEELARWRQASLLEGFSTVDDWLAALADAQCKDLGDALYRPVLDWKSGRFGVLDGKETRLEVGGVTAWPFGIYKDGAVEYEFNLVHLPTGICIIHLGRRKDCQALAHELALLRLDWAATDAAKILGPDVEAAREILDRYRRELSPYSNRA